MLQVAVWIGVVAVMSYVYFMMHILIHMCVHGALFRTRTMNESVGGILCSLQLVHFEGWRIAHMMHHLHCNTDKDPHRVDRPMWVYVPSHYFRIARAVWEPRRYMYAVLPPTFLAAAVVIWQASVGNGALGLWLVLAFWFVPMAFAHFLVAHFNYITHVGLPPGRGENTRSFKGGLWKLVNLLTFNFYLHAEHHLRPGKTIPQPIPEAASSGADSPSPQAAVVSK